MNEQNEKNFLEFFKQIDEFIKTAESEIGNDKFISHFIVWFKQGMSLSLGIMKQAFILVEDYDGYVHAVHADEKWKLINAILLNEYEITCIDLIQKESVTFATDRRMIEDSLKSYEKVYNKIQERSFEITKEIEKIDAMKSNQEKIEQMRVVADSLKDFYYSTYTEKEKKNVIKLIK